MEWKKQDETSKANSSRLPLDETKLGTFLPETEKNIKKWFVRGCSDGWLPALWQKCPNASVKGSSLWLQTPEWLQAFHRCWGRKTAGNCKGGNKQLQQELHQKAAAWFPSQVHRKATFWAAAATGQVIIRDHFSLLQINSKLKGNVMKRSAIVFVPLPLFIERDSKCLPQSKQKVWFAHVLNTCIISHGSAMSIWGGSGCTRHSLQKLEIMVLWHSQLLFQRGDKCWMCFHKDSSQRYSQHKCYSFCSLLRWWWWELCNSSYFSLNVLRPYQFK